MKDWDHLLLLSENSPRGAVPLSIRCHQTVWAYPITCKNTLVACEINNSCQFISGS